jgi:2-oxoisovalerate dehydrogenase E1 component
MQVVPSTACLVVNELAKGREVPAIPAFDISAACSGYLYALAVGHGLLQGDPKGCVLVITAEALSRAVDPRDFKTAILFADAVSATVLYGSGKIGRAQMLLHKPLLSGKPEDGSLLSVPFPGTGFVAMDGKSVFREAIAGMAKVLVQACQEKEICPDELALIVPHQANGRITEAVSESLQVGADRVFNNIRRHGNTSSSSIPLALSELGPSWPGPYLALCAFGGGFTCGAAILVENQNREKNGR